MKVAILVIAVLVATRVSAQRLDPPVETAQPSVDSIRQRLAPCFDTLGVDDAVPRARGLPPGREWVGHPLRPTNSRAVSDGYDYVLFVHGNSQSVYVVQSGGLAGLQTVFGPIPLDAPGSASGGCPLHPSP